MIHCRPNIQVVADCCKIFFWIMAVTMDAGRSRFYRGQELTES